MLTFIFIMSSVHFSCIDNHNKSIDMDFLSVQQIVIKCNENFNTIGIFMDILKALNDCRSDRSLQHFCDSHGPIFLRWIIIHESSSTSSSSLGIFMCFVCDKWRYKIDTVRGDEAEGNERMNLVFFWGGPIHQSVCNFFHNSFLFFFTASSLIRPHSSST